MAENDNEILTKAVWEEIDVCETTEELKQEILPQLRTQEEAWARKINAILAETKYSQGELGRLCGKSRATVNHWCKGTIPKQRELFIRIGLAAGYSLEEMNQLLQRYGHYSGLYSKTLSDCAAIYVIQQGEGKSGAERIELYDEILERIHGRLFRRKDSGPSDIITTKRFDDELAGVQDEEALERFIEKNIAVFSGAYHKLYSYVEAHIQENYMPYTNARTIAEIADIQNWSSSLRTAMSEIRQNKWEPNRNKIISLGLHLCMDEEQINTMLEYAHMEPLYVKNTFEGVIRFILVDALMSDLFNPDAEGFHPDNLYLYAAQVMRELDLPETDGFLAELEEPEEEREEE